MGKRGGICGATQLLKNGGGWVCFVGGVGKGRWRRGSIELVGDRGVFVPWPRVWFDRCFTKNI